MSNIRWFSFFLKYFQFYFDELPAQYEQKDIVIF